jgi:hypothetical protein
MEVMKHFAEVVGRSMFRLIENVRVYLLRRQLNTKRLNYRRGKEAGLGPGNAVLQVHCVVGEAVDTETGVSLTCTEISSSVLHIRFESVS